jgi:hypothetical protein
VRRRAAFAVAAGLVAVVGLWSVGIGATATGPANASLSGYLRSTACSATLVSSPVARGAILALNEAAIAPVQARSGDLYVYASKLGPPYGELQAFAPSGRLVWSEAVKADQFSMAATRDGVALLNSWGPPATLSVMSDAHQVIHHTSLPPNSDNYMLAGTADELVATGTYGPTLSGGGSPGFMDVFSAGGRLLHAMRFPDQHGDTVQMSTWGDSVYVEAVLTGVQLGSGVKTMFYVIRDGHIQAWATSIPAGAGLFVPYGNGRVAVFSSNPNVPMEALHLGPAVAVLWRVTNRPIGDRFVNGGTDLYLSTGPSNTAYILSLANGQRQANVSFHGDHVIFVAANAYGALAVAQPANTKQAQTDSTLLTVTPTGVVHVLAQGIPSRAVVGWLYNLPTGAEYLAPGLGARAVTWSLGCRAKG